MGRGPTQCPGQIEQADVMLARMEGVLGENRKHYSAKPDDAKQLLAVGAAPKPEDLDPADLAAWTLLANAVLSSDATIVKD